MPRQSRGPSRPSAAPARRPLAPQTQQRPATTMAAPPASRTATPATSPQSSQGGSMLGNIAQTATGVMIGSSVGHMIGGMFGGGSQASTPVEDTSAQAPTGYGSANSDMYAYSGDGGMTQQQSSSAYNERQPCETDNLNFRSCMTENKGDLTVCGWYLDQLKACRAAAAPY